MNEQMQVYAAAAISTVTLATYYADATMAKLQSVHAMISAIRMVISGS